MAGPAMRPVRGVAPLSKGTTAIGALSCRTVRVREERENLDESIQPLCSDVCRLAVDSPFIVVFLYPPLLFLL
jgi:hypothetical protein